jgi:hypothetical protein
MTPPAIKKLIKQAFDKGIEIGSADAYLGMFSFEDCVPEEIIADIIVVGKQFKGDDPYDIISAEELCVLFELGYQVGYNRMTDAKWENA